MNDTQIVGHLNQLFGEILENSNGEFKRCLKNSAFFAGGCIASLMQDEKPNDYDLYFTDEADAMNIVWLINTAWGHGTNISFSSPNFRYKRDSRFAITMHLYRPPMEVVEIQLIFRFAGKPEDLLSKFDFQHCQSYYLPQTLSLNIPRNTRYYAQRKEIYYNTRSPFPGSAINRLLKFSKRGYHIPNGTVDQILVEFSKLNFKDPNTLKDQMVGYYE
jgi:hypothetical protein